MPKEEEKRPKAKTEQSKLQALHVTTACSAGSLHLQTGVTTQRTGVNLPSYFPVYFVYICREIGMGFGLNSL